MVDIERYKRYPASHFSKWRANYQLALMFFFITPFMKSQYRLKVIGRQNVPKTARFIVASNHISMVDPPMLCYALKRAIAFMAKKDLFRTRFQAAFYDSVGCFALDRESPDLTTMKTAFNVLKSPGPWALCIFPEGTRNIEGTGILPLRKGIGSMASKFNIPILPVGIRRDGPKGFQIQIGSLITDISDADRVQTQVADALNALIQPLATP